LKKQITGGKNSKYYFTYNKGFCHLPYNGNSPETLVDSFDKFPFVKHSKEKNASVPIIRFVKVDFIIIK
jgi:hypothetical protein